VTLLPRRRQVRRVLPWRPGAPLRRRAMVRQHPCLGARLRVRPGRTRALPPPQRTAATSGANTATTSAHPASRSSTGTTPRSSLHSSPRTASTSLVPHLIAAMDFAGFQCFDPDFALGAGHPRAETDNALLPPHRAVPATPPVRHFGGRLPRLGHGGPRGTGVGLGPPGQAVQRLRHLCVQLHGRRRAPL
jgi:hypothetical protein